MQAIAAVEVARSRTSCHCSLLDFDTFLDLAHSEMLCPPMAVVFFIFLSLFLLVAGKVETVSCSPAKTRLQSNRYVSCSLPVDKNLKNHISLLTFMFKILVDITLEDINDNDPVFKHRILQGTVRENTPIGEPVIVVSHFFMDT